MMDYGGLLGRGVEQDHAEAFELYTEGAEQGYDEAQYVVCGLKQHHTYTG